MLMKSIINSVAKHIAILLLACMSTASVWAQVSEPCDINIIGDFEASCLHQIEGQGVLDENQGVLLACQGNQVTYRAIANTGGVTIISWQWSVQGESSWTDNHDGTISVVWGMGQSGQLSVTVNTATTNTCSVSKTVKLIEKPVINVTSTPAYTVENGWNVIYVCPGQRVEFIDESSTTNTDIAGYVWKSDYHGSTSTENFIIEDINQPDKIVHRVYNNCGCYDEEIYEIRLLDGERLDLSCYGTVCENAVVTYEAYSPYCNQHVWFVDGGTIIDGQNTPKVTVQWDNAHNGYGIIGLDGSLCGNNACPNMLSRKIPVIQDGLFIEGQTAACVDESVVYSLPLFGSTEYTWTITPSNGVQEMPLLDGNKRLLTFSQPGTYQLSVSYKCDFLGCGIYHSAPLSVTVKPRLRIDGEERICTGQSCDLSTNPNVNVTWKVYEMDNNDHLFASVANTNNLVINFTSPGKYLITAEHPNYCQTATFVLNVSPAPPAPTIYDIYQDNPTTACLNSSILLKANPQNPNYNIIWQPVCQSASPEQAAGNEVTITYENEICNVAAYTYDRKLNCMSTSAYIQPVQQFHLSPLALPDEITVCPGTTISWGSEEIPYQPEVLYRWIIEEEKQYCASIQGDELTNSVDLLINEIATPESFYVQLERVYCTDSLEIKTVRINVRGREDVPMSIVGNTDVCLYSDLQLIATGCNSGNYYWSASDRDGLTNADTLHISFGETNNVNVTLMCNNYDVCDNPSYYSSVTQTITIHPLPQYFCVVSSENNMTLSPTPPSGYSYQWYANGVAVPGATNNHIAYTEGNEYSCMVTNEYGCSRMAYVCNSGGGSVPGGSSCEALLPGNISFDYCSGTLSIPITNANSQVYWDVYPDRPVAGITYSGTNNEIANIQFDNVGDYSITARTQGNPCQYYFLSYTVDFLPKFSFEKSCDKIIIHNESQYLGTPGTLYFTSNGNPNSFYFPINNSTYNYYTTSGSYTFNLVSYSTLGSLASPCPYVVNITNSSSATLEITTANENNQQRTCNNTPLALSASLTPTYNINYYDWNFGDNSSKRTEINPVYHTFKNNISSYLVQCDVFDENGCAHTGIISITSMPNSIVQGRINVAPTQPVCPYESSRVLTYKDRIGLIPSPATYDWRTVSTILEHTNPYDALFTADYYVLITNENYCRDQAMHNVQFKNAPTAIIIPESYKLCLGDEMTLYGSPDPDQSSYTFSWSISYDNTIVQNFSDATITFSPTMSGVYTINLIITNGEGCSSTAVPVNITVYDRPAAPSIDFNGNKCINNPPVELSGSTNVGTTDLRWSNGDNGTYANYYYPGVATAYYYDPSSGCKSDIAAITIDAEPDFDALLTGCYEKCEGFFPNQLPVWGMTRYSQNYRWQWYWGNDSIAGGVSNIPYLSLPLPPSGFGSYWLDVHYQGTSCNVKSPFLTIKEKETCDCDFEVVAKEYKMEIVNCEIKYFITFMICNNGTEPACLDKIIPLFHEGNGIIVNSTGLSTSVTLNPGDCYSINMVLTVSGFEPRTASFQIISNCSKCTKDFTFDIIPQIDCSESMTLDNFHARPDLSNSTAVYFDFYFNVSPVQSVMSFWSEPPMILNYSYNGISTVHGLGMIELAMLKQLIAENGKVCFYAITCYQDELCLKRYCIPAKKLYRQLREQGLQIESFAEVGDGNTDTDTKMFANTDCAHVTDPRLIPNPSTGEVNVIGTTDEVVEVLVMDMNGRQMTVFENTSNFNISTLSSGIYIVRVKTRHDNTEKVAYLKLVKK